MFSDDTARKTKELLDFWQMEEMEIEGELIKIGYDEEVEKMLINENEHALVKVMKYIKGEQL